MQRTTVGDQTTVENDRELDSHLSESGKTDDNALSRVRTGASSGSSVTPWSRFFPSSFKSAKIEPNTNESITGASQTATNLEIKNISQEDISEEC